jgi:hypothetical protein
LEVDEIGGELFLLFWWKSAREFFAERSGICFRLIANVTERGHSVSQSRKRTAPRRAVTQNLTP